MTTFLRLLADNDKFTSLQASCGAVRSGQSDARVFQIAPDSFRVVPGAPFAYWVTEAVRQTFVAHSPMQTERRVAAIGASTKDDGRFLRLNWEVDRSGGFYPSFAKGGHYSPFYADIPLTIRWKSDGLEAKTFVSDYRESRGWSPHWKAELHNPHYYFRPGLTWPRRTQGGLSLRAMPRGCIFADKGPATFVADDAPEALLALLALVNSEAFGVLVSLQMAFGSYEVGVIQKTPVPDLNAEQQAAFTVLARRAWSLKRALDTVEETSHAFVLPAALRAAVDYDPPAIRAELERIQAQINAIAYDLYGFSEADRTEAQASQDATTEREAEAGDDQNTEDNDDEDSAAPIDHTAGLLSWAVGVAFGRFDCRLATGERAAPPEPDPFDPLPARSPGMMPDGAAPFHAHAGIIVDDPGHLSDLARLVEEVLTHVDAPVPSDVRRWLQRDFFPFHLQRYSKSRRKAPIYLPLTTTSGSYTLWIYYPSLSSQTLYTAINDFLDGPHGKLTDVSRRVSDLRNKGAARNREDERQFEILQSFELELTELRDTLLKLAPSYKPNHDDGVQIGAAPLWPLFRHKPWQKVLKDTWAKLEKGDYDWSHLAMNYWPERVREKCKTDKSLAVAHGLESLYAKSEDVPKKGRGRKKAINE